MCISWTINGLISLMHGITMKAITCFKSLEDGYFWDVTLVDCCTYTGRSQDPAGFVVKAGDFMYPDHGDINVNI